MRRPLLILLPLFLLAVAGVWTYLYVTQKENAPEPVPVTFPSGSPEGVPRGEGERIVVKGKEGVTFSVPEITQAPGTAVEPYEEDEYVIAEYCLINEGCTDAAEGNGFRIVFEKQRQSFDVLLLAEPLGESRAKATQFLAKTLELTPSQVCSLNVSVGTINAVNGFYAGEELGLSGCPGAVQLP